MALLRLVVLSYEYIIYYIFTTSTTCFLRNILLKDCLWFMYTTISNNKLTVSIEFTDGYNSSAWLFIRPILLRSPFIQIPRRTLRGQSGAPVGEDRLRSSTSYVRLKSGSGLLPHLPREVGWGTAPHIGISSSLGLLLFPLHGLR